MLREQRNTLLAAMTDEVAGLVLADNYAQTQALSMMESRAAERLGEHARLIRVLETQGLLDRELEFLPADEQMEERRASGRGLTRPELAVILSYSKIELVGSLVHTDIPEDPYLGTELESYFPPQLRTPIGGLIRKHRLAREIIAMLIGGSMINRMGPFFVLRAEEETGANVAQVARAYAIVREDSAYAVCGARSRRSTTRCRRACNTTASSRSAEWCGVRCTGSCRTTRATSISSLS